MGIWIRFATGPVAAHHRLFTPQVGDAAPKPAILENGDRDANFSRR